jgi:hypothetical protein
MQFSKNTDGHQPLSQLLSLPLFPGSFLKPIQCFLIQIVSSVIRANKTLDDIKPDEPAVIDIEGKTN